MRWCALARNGVGLSYPGIFLPPSGGTVQQVPGPGSGAGMVWLRDGMHDEGISGPDEGRGTRLGAGLEKSTCESA